MVSDDDVITDISDRGDIMYIIDGITCTWIENFRNNNPGFYFKSTGNIFYHDNSQIDITGDTSFCTIIKELSLGILTELYIKIGQLVDIFYYITGT